MKKYSYLFNVVLLAFAALTGWMVWSSSHKLANKSSSLDKPDGFMTHIEMTQFNKDGKINFILQSPNVSHYPIENSTLMSKPSFTIYSDFGKPPWHITSQHGKATGGTDTVFLWENVVITQQSESKQSTTNMNSEEVYYYPNQRMAETSKDIIMKQPRLEVDATGLKVYFDTGIAKLLSQVKGNYDPTKNSS